jgi:hypothetical protein
MIQAVQGSNSQCGLCGLCGCLVYPGFIVPVLVVLPCVPDDQEESRDPILLLCNEFIVWSVTEISLTGEP